MTIGGATRNVQDFNVEYMSVGLNTIDDPIVVNVHSAKNLQNLRAQQYRLRLRYGTTMASTKQLGRPTGLHQSYPISLNPGGRRYYSSRNSIFRIIGNIPNCTFEEMQFPDGASWGLSDHVSFNDFGDYTFAFNGKDAGMTLSVDGMLNKMWYFQIAKPEYKPTITKIAGGSITGSFRWKYRYARQYDDGSIEYMGPYSDPSDSYTLAGENAGVQYIVPTDEQVNLIMFYRTTNGGTAYFHHDNTTDISSGVWIDNKATTDTTIQHYSTVDRLLGIKYGCNDSGVFVAYGTKDEDNVIYWSLADTPQEILPDYTTKFIEGAGKSMGIGSINGYLVAWREKGMLTLQMNANGVYDRIQFKGDVGNIAPKAITTCHYKGRDYLSFWDETEGPCLTDGINVLSLKVITKQIGPNTNVNTDIFNIVKNNIKVNSKKNICAAYHNNQLIYSFNKDSAQDIYNDSAVIYDFVANGWFGIDTGYFAGPMFTCMSNQGLAGSGELLCMHDGASTALIQLFDESSTYDYDFDNTAPGTLTKVTGVTVHRSAGLMTNPNRAIDNDIATAASLVFPITTWMAFNLNKITIVKKIRVMLTFAGGGPPTLAIYAHEDNGSGYVMTRTFDPAEYGTWVEIDLPATSPTGYITIEWDGMSLTLNEIEFYEDYTIPLKTFTYKYQSPKIGSKTMSRKWEFARYWLVAKISRNVTISFNTYSRFAEFTRTIIQKPYNAGTWDESLWDDGQFGEIDYHTYEKGLPCYNQGMWTEVTIEGTSEGVMEIAAFKIKGIDRGEI